MVASKDAMTFSKVKTREWAEDILIAQTAHLIAAGESG